MKPLIDGQNETIVENEVNGTEIVLNTEQILRQKEENKIKNRERIGKYREDIKQQIIYFQRETDRKTRDQINEEIKRQKIKYFQRYPLKRVEANHCKQFGKSNNKSDKQSKCKTEDTIKCRKTQSTQTILTAEDVINC